MANQQGLEGRECHYRLLYPSFVPFVRLVRLGLGLALGMGLSIVTGVFMSHCRNVLIIILSLWIRLFHRKTG